MNDTIPAPLTASPPSTSPQVNVVLRLTRHLIGVSVAVSLVPSVIYGPGRGFAWLGGVLFCILGAAVVTALAALFFTRTQASKSTHNFIVTVWAIVGLTLFGQWGGNYVSVKEHNEAAAAQPTATEKPIVQKDKFGSTLVQEPLNGAYSANDTPAPAPASEVDKFLASASQQQNDKEFLGSRGIGGNQNAGDVVAWGDAQLAARSIQGENLSLAHKFAIQWQYQVERDSSHTPIHSLYIGYMIVINHIDRDHRLCKPDPARVSAITNRGDGTSQTYPTCMPL